MTSTSTNRRQGVNAGLAIKVPVRVATTANITLSGEQTIDGVAVVTDDRVLVKDQTDATENGIYVADTSSWERAIDFDGTFDVVEGTLVQVNQGTLNGSSMWRVANEGTITIDETELDFEEAVVSAASSVTFTPTGSGAVTRSVQGKLRDVIHASDFGVDTSGSNKASELQAAVTAAAGRTLILPSGTIIITSGITVSSPVHFIGDGVNGSVISRNFSPASDSIGAFTLGETVGCKFSNVKLKAGAGTSGGCLVSGVSTAGTAGGYLTFENCLLTFDAVNNYTYALYLDGSLHASGYTTVNLVNTYIHGGTSGAARIKSVVRFNWNGGGSSAEGSTSGGVDLSGTAGVPTQKICISVSSIAGLVMDRTQHGSIIAGYLDGSITNSANTTGMVVAFGEITGSIQTNWANSVILAS